MDVAEFALIRPSRRPDPKRTVVLKRTLSIPPQGETPERPRPIERATGHDVELVAQRPSEEPPPEGGVRDIESGSRVTGPVSATVQPTEITPESIPAEYGSPEMPPLEHTEDGAGTVLGRIYTVVRAVEAALTTGSDLLASSAVLAEAIAAAPSGWDNVAWGAIGGNYDGSAPYRLGRLLITHHLSEALTRDGLNAEPAVLLTRWALVAELLCRVASGTRMTSAEVRTLLQDQPLVVQGLDSDPPASKVKLIREATVRDMQVMRREWAGYVAGEIASVRNMMPGESFAQHDGTVRESETTLSSSTDRTEETSAETESKQATELSNAVATELGVTINGHAEAAAEFRYPVVTTRISGGVDAGLSLQRSEQQAARIAREAVAKATTRVETITRESRVQRDLSRTDQSFDYAVRNSTGNPVHGVYRWVDRVDTYQLFRFTDRLQLEFQIPEPATFFRWRRDKRETAAAAVDQPPPWTVTAEEITPEKLITLASHYRATNLPAPPDPTLVVARPLVVAAGDDGAKEEKRSNPPTASGDLTIPIPSGYETTEIRYEGEGYPMIGDWRDENFTDVKGTHSAFATISVGAESDLYWNGGMELENDMPKFYATFGDNRDVGSVGATQVGSPPYGRTFVPIGGDGTLNPTTTRTIALAGVRDSLVVSVHTLGVLSCSVTFAVDCKVTAEEMHNWRMRVYDTLFVAWSQWKRDHEADGIRDDLLGRTGAIDAGGTLRNDAAIREELKRSVIGWLLGEAHFAGRPALHPEQSNDPLKGFSDIDVAKAIETAPFVQFLEQAFEWNNIAYVFYPYYWAARERWETLSQITSDDPEFERFLRAGSSRVIVPARPSFTDAIKNYLIWGLPFVSGRLPSPDNELYVALETEIREISGPPTGGFAGEHWQTRTTTTMKYLEKDSDLPFTNPIRTLPAPAGKEYVVKDIVPLVPDQRQEPQREPGLSPDHKHVPSPLPVP